MTTAPLIAAGAIGVWTWLAGGPPLWMAATCALGWTLVALAWIDWRSSRLPDVLTLPLLLAGLVLAWMQGPDDLAASTIGAIAGYAALAGVDQVYYLVRGQHGLGRGDAKLLAAGGAWLGWEALPFTVLLAALTGLLLAGAQRVGGRTVTRQTAMPFGPALALGIWLVRLYGVPGA